MAVEGIFQVIFRNLPGAALARRRLAQSQVEGENLGAREGRLRAPRRAEARVRTCRARIARDLAAERGPCRRDPDAGSWSSRDHTRGACAGAHYQRGAAACLKRRRPQARPSTPGRKSRGRTPKRVLNARAKWAELLKPQEKAISVIDRRRGAGYLTRALFEPPSQDIVRGGFTLLGHEHARIARIFSPSARKVRAWVRRAAPLLDRSGAPPRRRTNICLPSRLSSVAIWLVTAGWEMPSRSAVRAK